MSTIGWYISDTSCLLNDQAFTFTSKPQLIRWINEARRQCAQRAMCVRRLISGQSAFGASAQPGSIIPGGMQPGAVPGAAPGAQFHATTNTFMTIPGVERYPYQGFVNRYLQAQHAGCKAVTDTNQVSVCWGGGVGGSPRPAIAWLPWEDFQAYARAYATAVQSYSYYWTVYNDGEFGEIWMFPQPSMAMELEFDVFCVPKDIYTDDDFDAIPDGFTNAIKFKAASLAYMMSRRYGQAQMMENEFADRIGSARVSVDHGKTPNFYF